MGGITPGVLKAGDKVALIAPARAVREEETRPFEQWLASKGLICIKGRHLYGRLNQFSGSDAERAEDFIHTWSDPEIKAVFCARGGYGSMRWTPLVPETLWQQSKWLVGYSDITTIHLELNRRGIPSIHGPVAINFQKQDGDTLQNIDWLERLLFEGRVHYNFSNDADFRLMRPARFEGLTIGGNLSLLFAAMGTPNQPDTRGKILFLEDLDEYVYHLDRMVQSLKQGGLFQGLAGLVVGGMHDMKDNAIPFGNTAEAIIEEAVADYAYPVLFGFPAGHGSKNACFKLNAFTTFDGQNFIQH